MKKNIPNSCEECEFATVEEPFYANYCNKLKRFMDKQTIELGFECQMNAEEVREE